METYDRLKIARIEAGYKHAKLAAQANGWVLSTYMAHEAGTRGVPFERLKVYAETYGVTVSWLLGEAEDRKGFQPAQRLQPPPTEVAQRMIPVYGSAVAGDDGEFELNGERLYDVPCLPNLAHVPNAYALQVSGESMQPRFEDGEIIYVDPTRRPRQGNVVVAEIVNSEHGPPLAFIKRLVSRTTSKLVLEQFNPEKEMEFSGQTVKGVHVIVGAMFEQTR